MSKHELTMKSAKRKLLRATFKLSVFVLVAGVLGYLLFQQSASAIHSKSDVLQRWLRGDIAKLNDDHLRGVFSGLENKLLKIADDVKGSGATFQLELVPVAALNAKHQTEKRAWKTNIADTEVNVGMGLISRGIDPRYQSRVREPAGPRKERYDAEDSQERERFSKGLHELYSAVTNQLGGNAQGVELDRYSDLLFSQYFRVDQEVKENYPELRVSWVYIASQDTGQIAFYPAINDKLELPFDERPWFNTSLGDKRYDPGKGKPRNTLVEGEQVTGRSDVGLTQMYGDFVSNRYTRTLWHTFQIGESRYVACIDLIMLPPASTAGRAEWAIAGLFSNASVAGRLANSVLFGLLLGGALFALGFAFVRFGGSWSRAAARRYISGGHVTESESSGFVVEPYSKVYMEYAEPAELRQEDSVNSSMTETMRGAVGLKTPHLSLDFEQQIKEERGSRLAETRRLGVSADEKWKIRGKELWSVYTRQHKAGVCRLCDQEIVHYGDGQRIGSVEVIHRMNHEPEVDFKRKRGVMVTNTDFIEDNLQWHALNTMAEKDVETGTQPLELYPKPRVPQQLAGHAFVERILTKYRRLNEGRYVATDELLQVSEAMLPNTIVQSVYRVSHMKKLLSEPRGKENLKLGKNIKRFLIAHSDEELQQFRTEFRAALAELSSSQKLMFAVFRGTPLAVLDTYKELNFSMLTLPDGFEVVIVAQSDGSVHSGYVSWREVDVSYYVALFKQIDDIASKLLLEEEQGVTQT